MQRGRTTMCVARCSCVVMACVLAASTVTAQQLTVDRVAWLQGCLAIDARRGDDRRAVDGAARRDDAWDGTHGSGQQTRGLRARADQGTGRPARVRSTSIWTADGDVHGD